MCKIIIALITTVTMSGCAFKPPAPKVFNFSGTKECNLAWERAQLVMATKGQITTNSTVLIQSKRYNQYTKNFNTFNAVRSNATNGDCSISFTATSIFGEDNLQDLTVL
ncbi:hypothetical protein OLJ30_001744 [Salmonella enterica]|nr:hypothetical protein [Salmonella enterica]EKA4644182.1 hypothetical protein [Salmonella enterica]